MLTVDLQAHTDFTARDTHALWRAVHFCPPTRDEAFVLVSGDAELLRMPRFELASWLRENGLSPYARLVERTPVPNGHTLLLLVGDEVRIRTLDLAMFEDEEQS